LVSLLSLLTSSKNTHKLFAFGFGRIFQELEYQVSQMILFLKGGVSFFKL